MAHEEPRVIAIASGKGGVGKTWLAITLAQALARSGRRVLLFDADLGLANVDVQLGLMPEADLGQVISGRMGIGQAITRHELSGLNILAGRSGSATLSSLPVATLDLLLMRLRRETAGYDVILADLGAGIDRAVRRIAAWSDLLLVVATDEPTSLTDAYAVLKLHASDRSDGDARIVINQAQTMAAGQRTYAALSRACSTFLRRDLKLAGIIRHDLKVRDAIRHQMPLLSRHPNAVAAGDVGALAAAVGW